MNERDLEDHLEEKRIGPATQAFLDWWREDAERNKCFLSQAIGSYCSGFPGRVLPLLVELLEGK